MQGYIERNCESIILNDLKIFPAVALLGPRQCGKSTLIKHISSNINNTIYLDLEKESDLRKLDDPELFFRNNSDNLVCLDEIQRRPQLFPSLRSILDRNNRNGQVIMLGSASRDLIKQSSETLAGRISFIELSPFVLNEIANSNKVEQTVNHLTWGGFPRSYLSDNNQASFRWRENFIRTFLERDIPQLGFAIPANTIGRLWRMCAHLHGQLLNSSKIGESLGISHPTVRNYLDLLEQTFMIRLLSPLERTLKKRIKKSPKMYIRDSGILHALLDIDSFNTLLAHPIYGASWEGYVIENIISLCPGWQPSFYRTQDGAEIDLVLEKGLKRIAVECKASSAPQVTKGFWTAMQDLDIPEGWIIAPVDSPYQVKENVWVSPLYDFIANATTA